MGRPPKITDEVVKLLEDAFKLDAPITEACQYAGISRTAYYDYINAHPEFLDRLERLKSMTRFKIRGKVISRALKDANFGLNYLKLKCDDFKEKRKVNTEHELINSDMSSSLAKLTDAFLQDIKEGKDG